MDGSLTGISVIDLSRNLPGPYCSMILADHGARVIAIEDKKSIPEDSGRVAVYRNKERMTLNLKTDEGLEIFRLLIKKSDVLIEGFRPGVSKRLGIDYETTRKINARLIYCSITGFGQNGPYRDLVGHDINYISVSGILNALGSGSEAPSIPKVLLGDVVGGSLQAVIGILLAIVARQHTGQGQHIDISISDGLLGLLQLGFESYQSQKKIDELLHKCLSGDYACYNIYETADGKYLSLGAFERRFWNNICEFFGVPEYGQLQYDEEWKKDILKLFRDIFKSKSQAEWIAELGNLDVCWAKVQDLSEVISDANFSAREMIISIADEEGKRVLTPGVCIKLNKTPGSISRNPEKSGKSTAKILKELGYTARQIVLFERHGTI